MCQQRPERGRLEQLPLATGVVDCKLGEDPAGLGCPRCLAGAPQVGEPRPQLLVGVGRVEDAPDDELGRHGAVPAVLLEPECDVEA